MAEGATRDESQAVSLLAGLDERQHDAVVSPATPLAVMAPAGSGKTRVLTTRVAHRIAKGEIDPAHVLCITFTRKAADEMRARLHTLGVHERIEVGTFHAVAWRQLRDRWAAQGRQAPTLLSRVRPFLREQLELTANAEIAELSNEIAWARARQIRPGEYAAAARRHGRRTRKPNAWIAERFADYEAAKSRRHVVDFDDLLAACTAALHGDEAFAAAQRWRFRHLFVDEFQDVNPLQFALLEGWRGAQWDVFVVGDSHQSIYGWNGAEPRLLDELGDRWPALEIIHLDRTHRSTPQITAAAATVIRAAGLTDRHPVSTGSAGPVPRIFSHRGEVDEIEGIARLIRRRRGSDAGWRSFAVLARTQDQVRDLERGLTSLGIPTMIQRRTSVLDSPAVRRALKRLRVDDRPILAVLADVLGDEDATDPDVESLARSAEEQGVRDPHMTGRSFAGWAQANLTDDDVGTDAVTISTIHAAKGLEWPVVHVAGCEDGWIPMASARRKDARDEEARLLYVAVTRAQREVNLHWAEERTIRQRRVTRSRSPFLRGFEEALADLTEPEPAPTPGRFDDLRTRLPGPAPIDPVLAALRAWRLRTAAAARTEPEVVISDESLEAIATLRPQDLDELGLIPGLGPSRISRHGESLVAVVARQNGS